MTERRTIIFDANNFSNLQEFFDEADRVLTHNINFRTGHNFDAFYDLLRGGFGVHEYEEPIKIKWLHASKSRKDLGMFHGKLTFDFLVEIINDGKQDGFDWELEIIED